MSILDIVYCREMRASADTWCGLRSELCNKKRCASLNLNNMSPDVSCPLCQCKRHDLPHCLRQFSLRRKRRDTRLSKCYVRKYLKLKGLHISDFIGSSNIKSFELSSRLITQ